ncbi:MAG: peptidyl-prolyl cis-trans isomerase [Solirubrobacterales bacterium]
MSPSNRKRPASGKGGGKGPAGKQPPDREAVRRFGLLVFGVGLVLLFAIVAISEGIGHPSVPDGDLALVEDVPDGAGAITQEDFRRRMEQSAAKGDLKVPKPGDPQYKELKEAAVGELIQAAWVKGQAAEMGISATDKEVDKKLEELKSQSFSSEAEYRKTIKDLKLTEADVRELMEFELLVEKIQTEVRESSPEPSDSEVEGYYEEVKGEPPYTTPASRDVRLIFNEDEKKAEEAKALLEKDSSPESWNKVAKKFSTESPGKDEGGLQRGLKEGKLEEPLDAKVFETPEDELEGVIKTPKGFYVFEVESSTPESVQSLDDAREQIEPLKSQKLEEAYFQQFVLDFEQTWRSRTFCAEGYTIKICANYEQSSDPVLATPEPETENCRKDVPAKQFPEACPAPVFQAIPALPGSVTPVEPQGKPLLQMPQPPGLEETEEEVPSTPLPPITP